MPDGFLIDLALAEKTLREYVKQAWHVVEPTTDYIHGWHIDAICEHLEAVTLGQITRLIINIPPRHMKSLLVGVLWPTWEWGPFGMPHTRWLVSSYADTLSTRDSLKCRRLIDGPWYQQRWGDRFTLTTDQNQKTRFENDKTGYRISTSVRGIGTGEGGDRIVVDDPHNVMKGESELDRLNTLSWWDESMSTRVNNPDTSAKIIIQQRVHERDLTGHCIAKELDYVHLCLPARYEPKHPHPPKTTLRFADRRTKEGEPLWPGLYHDVALSRLEAEMTEYAKAGQLQQRPAPRGGGLFEVDQFKLIDTMPPPQNIVASVRYWDKAATEGGGANTAGVLMHRTIQGRYIIEDCKTGQWGATKRNAKMKHTAEVDGYEIVIWTEQEPGSGGKESAEATVRDLAGYRVYPDRVTGSKEVRAEPYSIQVNAGNVMLVKGEWVRKFLDEHELFPRGSKKDQVDAAAGAFNKLVGRKVAGSLLGGGK